MVVQTCGEGSEACCGSDDRMTELSPEEFFARFRTEASEWLCNAYISDHPLHRSQSGSLYTTLCEDVYSVVDIQLGVLHDYIFSNSSSSSKNDLINTPSGNALLLNVLQCIYRNLRYKQYHFRNTFLQQNDLEKCCATANDFFRMMERTEEILPKIWDKYPHLRLETRTGDNGYDGAHDCVDEKDASAKRRGSSLSSFSSSSNPQSASLSSFKDEEATEGVEISSPLRVEESALLSLYSMDAVFAAQMIHMIIFESISESSIPQSLFTLEWEANHTSNEIVLSLVRTMEDYLIDVEMYLQNDFLHKKVLDTLVSATIIFYVRTLLTKKRGGRGLGGIVGGKRKSKWSVSNPFHKMQSPPLRTREASPARSETWRPFYVPKRAVRRMQGDIDVMKSFFTNMIPTMPALAHVIDREFAVLHAIHECLSVACGLSLQSSLPELITVLHKHAGGNFEITRLLFCDLWFLAGPPEEQYVALTSVMKMRGELSKMHQSIQKGSNERRALTPERDQIPGLRFDEMLAEVYSDDIRIQQQRTFRPPPIPNIVPSESMETWKVDFTNFCARDTTASPISFATSATESVSSSSSTGFNFDSTEKRCPPPPPPVTTAYSEKNAKKKTRVPSTSTSTGQKLPTYKAEFKKRASYFVENCRTAKNMHFPTPKK